MIQSLQHHVDNGDGWTLSLYQTFSDEKIASGRRPVLIVPGYGMNSFIFSYHPSGVSLEGFLAEAGFEVWRVDLRAQGESVPRGAGDGKAGDLDRYGLYDLAVTDLGATITAVLALTRTGADRVDVIGASLGGTILFIHAALNPGHRVGSMVAMGSPVRWVKIHPVLRVAFSSPFVAGLVRLKGTRRMAELVLPLVARRAPWLLSVYMNAGITDLSAAKEMVRTVEDPNRRINRQIAHWIRDRDLIIRGTNVSQALGRMTRPLLCVVANGDGIVPRETAIFPYEQVRSSVKAVLEVGTDATRLAHADMFVSNESHARVFGPIAKWLEAQAKNVA